MKLLIVYLCLLFLLACQTNNDEIVIGKIHRIHSEILKEQRTIFVSVPKNNGLRGAAKYPVIYLLDGEGHFSSVTGMVERLSEDWMIPEMIVVGITNTNRMRDLTPTRAAIGYDGRPEDGLKISGGGEKFLQFIKDELMPYIDDNYPTAPYKILIGHSLGGLTAMNTLIHHSELFNAYVAIDPSMWWDKKKLLKNADTVLRERSFANKQLFIAVANTMRTGMDTMMVNSDTSIATSHIRSILHSVSTLRKYHSNGLLWNWKYYNDDTHSSVPLIAEYDGLRFFFNSFPFNLPDTEKDSGDVRLTSFLSHYDSLSKRMGYKVVPSENLVNNLALESMYMKHMNSAQAFFQLNIKNFPGSFSVYDKMGDFYAANGNRHKAIEQYSNALKINNHGPTREKAEKLKAMDK